MLEVHNLVKNYVTEAGTVQAVRGVSFKVERGEFYTLLGPSGCGKTTILRSVAGLEAPQGGEIVIAGEKVFSAKHGVAVPAHLRKIGMVFQSYAIWPHMDVFNNVAVPLIHGKRRLPKGEVGERVSWALRLVKLSGLEKRPAPWLSGGQQQRVALARALALQPEVLLLDEPLSNLDAKLREEMRLEIKQLVKSLGITSIYVTHDQVEALAMSDRVAVMNEGLLQQEGTPRDIYGKPRNVFTANFVGKTNLLDGRMKGEMAGGNMATLETRIGALVGLAPDGLRPGETAVLSVRPESVFVWADPPNGDSNVVRGEVTVAVFCGDYIQCEIQCEGQIVRARLDPTAFDVSVGKKVYVHFPPERCNILKAES